MSVLKRRKAMMAAVIAAVAVFAVCAFSAGANLSGYDRLKAAGFQLIDEINKEGGAYSNGMFWFSGAFYIDGVEIARSEQTVFRDGERELKSESTKYGPGGPGGPHFFSYGGDDASVSYTDGDVAYYWRDGGFSSGKSYQRPFRNGYIGADVKDAESGIMPAQRRFIEAVADALVGDTRSYFVSDSDFVSISLSGNQIPELAQYAVAAFAERAGQDMFLGDNDIVIGADARFTQGSLEVRFDADDNIIGGKLSGEIVSTVHGSLKSYRLTAEYKSKNIGSTVVQKPDGNAFGTPVLPSYEDSDTAGVTYSAAPNFV